MLETGKNIALTEATALVQANAVPVRQERVRLDKAFGRVLQVAVIASRDQPPFKASAMDGYAIQSNSLDPYTDGLTLTLIGKSVAGRHFKGKVARGEAVRIFTGAPVPEDCDRVIIQENTKPVHGGVEILPDALRPPAHVRQSGQDFKRGQELLCSGLRLDPWRLSLVAAAGLSKVIVARRPKIAVLCTGDELVLPGNDPETDQIFESASFALMALIAQWGAKASYVGLQGDTEKAIHKALKSVKADLIVTVGGASVGEFDLVKPALTKLGLNLEFSSISVRPGKPTSFGALADGRRVLGLPGNPASAFVMAQLLLKPWIEASLGISSGDTFVTAISQGPLPGNGPRESYLRGKLSRSLQGQVQVSAFDDQDSSLVSVFARADALIRLAPNSLPQNAGARVEVIALDRM